MLSALLPQTRDRSNAKFGKRIISLQRIQFVAYQFSIFQALPTTMDRINAKLREGVKHLS